MHLFTFFYFAFAFFTLHVTASTHMALSRTYNPNLMINIKSVAADRTLSLSTLINAKPSTTKRAVAEPFKLFRPAALILGVQIGVGQPASKYTLGVDFISANTWIGAGAPYKRTSASVATPNSVDLSGNGLAFNYQGKEFLDTVTISDTLIIKNLSIGVATSQLSSVVPGIDGILGLAPTDALSVGSLSPASTTPVPTILDTAFANHAISHKIFSLYLQPLVSTSSVNGELSWGGTNGARHTSAVHYTQLNAALDSVVYAFNQSITYGFRHTIVPYSVSIIDQALPVISFGTHAFGLYMQQTGAVLDPTTGLYTVTSAQYAKMQSLYFHINNVSYEFTPNAQRFPRVLSAAIGGSTSKIYLCIIPFDNSGTPGVDVILGASFLERFYTVYDTLEKRVGFATTAFTRAETN